MYTVIVTLDAKPGMEDAARQSLLDLVPPTRQEAGCIDYHLHECNGQPGRFVLYENWASEAAWEEHMQMPYLQDALAKVPELFSDAADLDKIHFTMLSDWSRRD